MLNEGHVGTAYQDDMLTDKLPTRSFELELG